MSADFLPSLDPYIAEWLNLALRWVHVITGIAWIGSSFYFNWQDSHLRPEPADPDAARLQGGVWMVHGGGFYHVRKYKLAPPSLPAELHWFKWEAYATWVSGFALLILVFFLSASSHLLPPGSSLSPPQGVLLALAVMAASWLAYDGLCRSPLGRHDGALAAAGTLLAALLAAGLGQVFSGRGAYMLFGACLGTIMAANVAMVIIPGQKVMVGQLLRGEAPDPVRGLRGKQRSLHNNYLTLPVLFTMIAGHFPSTYGHTYAAAILLALAGIGALVRHAFNLKNKGRPRWVLLPAAAAGMALLALVTRPAPSAVSPVAAAADAAETTPYVLAAAVLQARCLACHATHNTHPDFPVAANGAIFETPEQAAAWAGKIRAQAVDSEVMPLGNLTGMTAEERVILGRWIAQGARIAP